MQINKASLLLNGNDVAALCNYADRLEPPDPNITNLAQNLSLQLANSENEDQVVIPNSRKSAEVILSALYREQELIKSKEEQSKLDRARARRNQATLAYRGYIGNAIIRSCQSGRND